MKLAIVGGRDFNLYKTLDDNIRELFALEGLTIVSGGAKGADSLAKEFALANELPLIEFLPDWDTHGKKAGYLRNQLIVDECDKLIAFWDGKSKGTKHSMHIAEKAGKLYEVVRYNNE